MMPVKIQPNPPQWVFCHDKQCANQDQQPADHIPCDLNHFYASKQVKEKGSLGTGVTGRQTSYALPRIHAQQIV
jgi:hypothetical protein